MFNIYEIFEDGKKYLLYSHEDRFTCEVWMRNHQYCTTALSKGYSKLVLEVVK